MLLSLNLDLHGQIVDFGSDLAHLVIRQMHSPKNVWERLGNLRLQSCLARHSFTLLYRLDFPQLSIALLLSLETRGFLGVALYALGCLLMVVVHMLLNRVSLSQPIEDVLLLLMLHQAQCIASLLGG